MPGKEEYGVSVAVIRGLNFGEARTVSFVRI